MSKDIKALLNKKKLLLAALTMSSAITLSGCEKDNYSYYQVGLSKIEYHTLENEETISGKIRYEDIHNIKILVFEKEENMFVRLVTINSNNYAKSTINNVYEVHDIKSDLTLINRVTYANDKVFYKSGDDINIIAEENISKYLIKNDNIKREYNINEIIEVFDNEVKPSFEEEYKVKKR